MKKFALTLILFLTVALTGCLNNQKHLESKIIYVDINGNGDYKNIQLAINAAGDGDTIIVHSGSYHESIKMDKTVKLIGQGNVTIYGDENSIKFFIKNHQREGYIVLISADKCILDGFNIINQLYNISVNGIWVNSSLNSIVNNTIKSACYGIKLYRNMGNIVVNNSVTHCEYCGIYIYRSDHNFISKNKISKNFYGMRIKGSNNTVFKNLISNNIFGVTLCCGAGFNTFYLNNFIDNIEENAQDYLVNNWDNETVGNYWSDYLDRYPTARQKNNMWDTPYHINGGGNSDRYPLIKPSKI